MKTLAMLAASAAVVLPLSAQAATIAALVGDNTLVHVDSGTLKATKTVKVSGVRGRVLGIDVRPADGMLYGLFADGTVATIDPASGKATAKSKLDAMPPAGGRTTVDFNPVADRMRVLGSEGTSLRANVDDGKVATDGRLKYADNGPHKGKMPLVVAGAYSNSFKGTKGTALYDIDVSTLEMYEQSPPNDGVLALTGKLGVAQAETIAFDILADGAGGNAGWMVADGRVYKVDVSNGKATEVGKLSGVKGAVRDIAILPSK